MKRANVTNRIQSAVQHALSVAQVSDPSLKRKLEFALLATLEAADAQANPGTPASWTRKVLDHNVEAQVGADPDLKDLFNEYGPVAFRHYNAHQAKAPSSPMSASARLQRLAGIGPCEANSEDEE